MLDSLLVKGYDRVEKQKIVVGDGEFIVIVGMYDDICKGYIEATATIVSQKSPVSIWLVLVECVDGMWQAIDEATGKTVSSPNVFTAVASLFAQCQGVVSCQ